MGYLRTMGAGLAGSTTKIYGNANVNQIQYGDKLQGLPPVNRSRQPYKIYKTKAGGNAPDRFRVFCMNQLGGIGMSNKNSQFASNADGIGWCPNPKNSKQGDIGINKADREHHTNRSQSRAQEKEEFEISKRLKHHEDNNTYQSSSDPGGSDPDGRGNHEDNICSCHGSIVSRQSPVNIITNDIKRVTIPISPLKVEYDNVVFSYDNESGNYVPNKENKYIIDYNGELYDLVQFHYHVGSEHTIDGEQFDAEVHLVHLNKNYTDNKTQTYYDKMTVESINSNQYVVIGLLFSNNTSLGKDILSTAFDDALDGQNNKISIDLTDLNNLSYYSFPGSLTSNPFTSTITWFVSDVIIKTNLQKNQIMSRAHTVRPIQRNVRDTALYFAKQ